VCTGKGGREGNKRERRREREATSHFKRYYLETSRGRRRRRRRRRRSLITQRGPGPRQKERTSIALIPLTASFNQWPPGGGPRVGDLV